MWEATVGEILRRNSWERSQKYPVKRVRVALFHADLVRWYVEVVMCTMPKVVMIEPRLINGHGLRDNQLIKTLPRGAKRAFKLAFPIALITLDVGD